MRWYFDVSSPDNSAAWRQLRSSQLPVTAIGLPSQQTEIQGSSPVWTTLAAIEATRRAFPAQFDLFLDGLLRAAAEHRALTDPVELSDIAGEAGIDRIAISQEDERTVMAQLAQWRQLGQPDLPCLVRPDGHVLIGAPPADALRRFAA